MTACARCVFLIGCLAVLCACGAENPPPTVAELTALAEARLAAGDSHGAALVYVQAVQQAPDDAELWRATAAAFEQAGDYETALAAVRSCVQTSAPRSTEAVRECQRAMCRVLLHTARVELDDLDTCYMAVRPDRPADVRAEDLLAAGLVLQRAGLHAQSVVFLQRAYAAQPTRLALQSLCVALLASGSQEDANRCADLLAVVDPAGARSRAVCRAVEDMDAAHQEMLRRAAPGVPSEDALREFRARALQRLHQRGTDTPPLAKTEL